MQTRLLILYAIVSAVVLCDNVDDDAKLRFFYSSTDHYTELPIDEADKIFIFPWYNSTRPTIIFAHGFTGWPGGPAVSSVTGAYLEHGGYNVVLLNWERLAAAVNPSKANSYVNWAAPNARKLGVKFAETLEALALAGLDLTNTHLIGHSLGAHIFGIAGNRLQDRGILLPWITGLDPAGVGFEGKPPVNRLNPKSAEFVAVVHSDPSKYGFSRALGTVDFWPNYKNGQVRQPGCISGAQPMFSPGDICSHNRCWELLIDTLKYPGTILGSYAKNFRTWKNYSAYQRNLTVLELGKRPLNMIPGNYYFVTKADSPYGLGELGL